MPLFYCFLSNVDATITILGDVIFNGSMVMMKIRKVMMFVLAGFVGSLLHAAQDNALAHQLQQQQSLREALTGLDWQGWSNADDLDYDGATVAVHQVLHNYGLGELCVSLGISDKLIHTAVLEVSEELRDQSIKNVVDSIIENSDVVAALAALG